MGGQRTISLVVEYPTVCNDGVLLPNAVTLGANEIDAVRHFNGTVHPISTVRTQVRVATITPSISKVIFSVWAVGYKSDGLALRSRSYVLANEGDRLLPMPFAKAGFIFHSLRPPASDDEVRQGGNFRYGWVADTSNSGSISFELPPLYR